MPSLLSVAQIVPRTESEGPGWRFAVWVQGCSLRCRGCCNPEMFPTEGGTREDPEALAARAGGVEGVSLLGGEPFEQVEASADFVHAARTKGLSVMVFTGYTRAELDGIPGAGRVLASTDLLVDGRFERDLLDTSRRWVGSTNQVVHFLSDRYRPEDERFRGPQTAELRLTRGELRMNGWPGLVPSLRRSS